MTDISDEQLEELKFCFEIFDKTGREVVRADDIQAMLQSMSLNPITADVTKVMKESDLAGKEIDLPTFASIYQQFVKRPPLATVGDINEAFKTIDREGNVLIPCGQLRNMLTIMADKITDAEYDQMIKKHEDENGMIDFQKMIKDVMSG